MEAALVSAATGALKPVLRKLAALLGDEYKRFKGVHGEIRSLTRELAAIDAFLLKMSEEEDPDVQDKVWMNEVRELSYDMEDSIDDFMKCVHDKKDTKPDGFLEKIKHSLGKLGKMKARRRIGNEIEDLMKLVIDVGERNERYKTRQAFLNTKNATVDPRAFAIFEHASNLVGIDEPKVEIIKLLTEDDGCPSMQRRPKMLSIVGSGGMGKTTLANQVYQELKEQFECQALVSVSRNPDLMSILRTILCEVAKKDYPHTEARDEQQLLTKISNFLFDKSYFIVVDDIWKKETWDVIKYAFPMTSSGIIITTTRMKEVANSCRSSFGGHIYNIRPLDIFHSRQLFHRRLFKSEEGCPSHLKEVSDQILKKCDGLPLAIIAISGLLANREETWHLWNQVKDSIGRALERNASVELMMKILSLSYFDLPPHLKTCLLYLSIFPEDAEIDKKDLIRRWIAEGFIHIEGIYTKYELGERCFNELVNRSLIQPVKTYSYGKVKSCRVHDIILDFITSKSIEENFVTFVGVPNLTAGTESKVRRLSLHFREQENFVLPTSLVLSHVRSLNVFGDSLEIPSLDEFRQLRALDFGGCKQLRNNHLANIGRLFQLRYLNLRWTNISLLPEQIGNARCLEMLDVRHTGVRELPASIANLRKLVHLLTDSDVKFPCGIVKMQALETLKYVSVFEQPVNFVRELVQLQNLRKLVLDFIYFEAVEDTTGVAEECKKVLASSLQNLSSQNLRSLTVLYGGSFLLEGSLRPMVHSLQKLTAYESAVPQVPKWVASLVNLQQLRLEVMGVGQEDLCLLGALPVLLILDLHGTAKCKDGRLTVSGDVGFGCLKLLSYNTLYEGVELMFATGSMPKLEKLKISYDADEIESLTSSGGAFDFGIENLPCLVTVICLAYGSSNSIKAAKAAMERAAKTHPNVPTLQFSCYNKGSR